MPLRLLLSAWVLSPAAWLRSWAYCAANVLDAFLLILLIAVSAWEELIIPRLASPDTALPNVLSKSLFSAFWRASWYAVGNWPDVIAFIAF